MTKITVVTEQDLPDTLPKPIEYRDPNASLPATRIHTWLVSESGKGHGSRDRTVSYLLTALISAGLSPAVSHV